MTIPTINCKIIDFPVRGKEMIILNEDGSYTILINAKLSNESQIEAYNHAIKHILTDDFNKSDVQSIELEAHK